MATVRRCIDCDVVLVDEGTAATEDAATAAGSKLGDGDQIGYELEGWGNQLKVTLEGMLDKAGINRAWEAGALVVSAVDEDAVDDLIATLEGGDVGDLGDGMPRVALEIEGIDADGHDELDARLLADGISHAWDDEGALVVAEEDEERVLAIVEDVLDGPPEEDDGLAAQQALSALYVTVDRLAKHPHDRKPATAFVVAVAGLADLGVPYGFTATAWEELVAEAEALADAVRPHADGSELETPEDEGEAGSDAEDGADDPTEVDEPPVDADADADAEADAEVDADADADPDADEEPVPASGIEADREAAKALRERLTDLV